LAAANWPPLATRPVDRMSPSLQQLVRALEQLSVGIFGRQAVRFGTGSISICPAQRVEAKIVPQERGGQSFVLLGVRPEWPLQEWSGLGTNEHRVGAQPFRLVRLPEEPAEAV